MKKILTGIFLISLVFCSTHLFAEDSATEDLKPTMDLLVSILGDESLKGDEKRAERRQKIMEGVKTGFDFREMSRRVLGRTWTKIEPAQQDYFTELMTKLLENVYIGKLETYTGQEIVFTQERQKGNRAQVTTLIEHEGVELPIHYIMQRGPEKWMVYDINIEGVSLVRNYQEQFKSILRKEKFDGLVKVIEEKNKSFELEAGS